LTPIPYLQKPTPHPSSTHQSHHLSFTKLFNETTWMLPHLPFFKHSNSLPADVPFSK
jgi:hypothetical protein